MRSRLALLALAGLAACATKEPRPSDTASPASATLAGVPNVDIAAVRRAIDSANARFAAAMVRGDTVTAAANYAPDVILMPADAKAAAGGAAAAKWLAGLMATTKVTSFDGHTSDVIATGDYAIEHGTFEMTLQPKTGKPIREAGKYLTVWKKQADGSYKIVRDMFNSDGPAK